MENLDDKFMSIAEAMSMLSDDRETKVGACIVDKNNNVIGTGYNRMPNGTGLNKWEKTKKRDLEDKNWYVCHAELNAIMSADSGKVKGCTLYTTLYPCNECAKIIIQSQIGEVVYSSNKREFKPDTQAAKVMMDATEIIIRNYILDGKNASSSSQHEPAPKKHCTGINQHNKE